MDLLNSEKYRHWMDRGVDQLVAYLPSLLLALLVLWVGMRLIKLFGRAVDKGMTSRHVEPTLRRFVGSLVSIGLKILLFITAIQMMGVQTTSFVAVIGAAGLAIGLALQGTLANFAGGVLVLLFKPYKVGDLIEAQGVVGNVKEIQIFTTVLLTPDSKTVIVPNGAAANGIITNYTAEGRIRVDCVLAIERNTDITKAREVLMRVMFSDPKVLRDPAPSVTMNKQLSEGVELAVRPYADPADYWDVYFATLEHGGHALLDAGIKTPTSEHKVFVQNI
ncbi:MAG TPA: mechanosensitive ion channel domain-containing protein [Flavobacteriales bacterium]|nr:mechanosensitive ion channel domain-containing protein [Flavobacteriales bacterium]